MTLSFGGRRQVRSGEVDLRHISVEMIVEIMNELPLRQDLKGEEGIKDSALCKPPLFFTPPSPTEEGG